MSAVPGLELQSGAPQNGRAFLPSGAISNIPFSFWNLPATSEQAFPPTNGYINTPGESPVPNQSPSKEADRDAEVKSPVDIPKFSPTKEEYECSRDSTGNHWNPKLKNGNKVKISVQNIEHQIESFWRSGDKPQLASKLETWAKYFSSLNKSGPEMDPGALSPSVESTNSLSPRSEGLQASMANLPVTISVPTWKKRPYSPLDSPPPVLQKMPRFVKEDPTVDNNLNFEEFKRRQIRAFTSDPAN